MTYADAILIAIKLCKKAGETEAADVLYALPQARISRNVDRINRKLGSVGIDLTAILLESKEANESRDTTRMAVASAKLQMALKIIDSKDEGRTYVGKKDEEDVGK